MVEFILLVILMQQDVNIPHVIQTGSGVQPAPYPMSNGGSLPGGKVACA
jgi:hypothetical protein